MAKGAAWMVLFKMLERGIGLCSIVVLARLLIPADFGLVALATAVIAVLELLGAFSFDIALIQRPDADRTFYDTAWSFNIVVGISACILLVALAMPTANFYGDPRLANVIYVLALAPLLSSVENIGVVVYRKNMEFQKDFAFLLSKKLLSVTVTLLLALTLRNYWALVVGILTGRFAGSVLSYVVNDYRPRFTLQRRKELMNFSGWLLFNNISGFVSYRIGDFIIGKTAGPAALGVYSVASEIANMPTTELVAPINRAVFPAYAKMNADQAALQEGYLRVAGVIALMTVPAALGIAATGDVLIPLIFGAKWQAAVPLVKVLAFFGLIQALQNNVGSVYYALGKPKLNTYVSVSYNVLMVPTLIVFSIKWGNLGATYALLCAAGLMMPINFGVVLNLLQLKTINLLAVLWRPVFSGITMLAAVLFTLHELVLHAPTLAAPLVLTTLILVGFVTYSGLLYLLWVVSGKPVGAELTILNQIAQRLQKLRRAQAA
jgi:lipopolysaccharide exporter